MYVARPPGVEGYLPIAALMNLKYFLLTGRVPELHPAAMFLLVTFVAIAFLFRKAFCSWLCPVGTLSRAVDAAFRATDALPHSIGLTVHRIGRCSVSG